ncbi:MAG: PrsW family intramembrane metalloprotease [Bacteroidaceae bacterium]|nr:PrsW family intramembrane metalloprotease [Bacteroidaceae bacterium]
MNLLIIATAMLPVVILMYIIYRKDSVKPEPKEQLRKAFYWGVLSCFLSFAMSSPFALIGLYPQEAKTVVDALRISFFGAAIPEEIAKFAVLWFFLRNNPYFDEKFDGIVYAACVSMGFAAFENIGYLFMNKDNFLTVGIVRAIFSVPGHLCFGIMMGYYYSLVKFYPNSKRHSTNCAMVLIVPILLHGLYDTMLFSIGTLPKSLVLVMFVAFLVFCFKMWKYAARRIEEHLARDVDFASEEDRAKCLAEFRRLAKENPKIYEPELANILAAMGDFCREHGDVQKAEPLYLEALETYRHIDTTMRHSYKAEMAKVYKNLGTMFFTDLGRNEDSKRAFSEAIHVHYTMGSNHQVDISLARVFCLLGDVYFQENRYSEAKEKYANALDLFRRRADKEGMAVAMQGIGNCNIEIRF